MSTWYYTDTELQRQGPASTSELKQYFRSEAICLETMVWRDGMLHWRPLGELAAQLSLVDVAELVSASSIVPVSGPPPVPAPPSAAPEPPAKVELPTTGRAVFDLGNDLSEQPPPIPLNLGEIRSRMPGPDHERGLNPYRPSLASLRGRAVAFVEDEVYAGFWKRAAAALVDGLIIGIFGNLGGEALGTIVGDLASGSDVVVVAFVILTTIVLNAVYFALFHAAFNLATPGKMVIGIKVVRSNGEPISFRRGIGRYFATFPSAMLLCAGYLMAAFTDRKRALHDFMCDTVVVDKWAFTGQPEMQRHEMGTATVVILLGFVPLIILLALFAPDWVLKSGLGGMG